LLRNALTAFRDMPELTIHVPSYIGPSYLQESEDGWYCEWVQGITKADVEMQIEWAKMLGEEPDSILLEISTCDGGSTIEGFAIYNYLRGLGLPIRCHILALAASMAVPLALAADELPEMDYTAQLMLHSATFNGGVYAETSVDLRAQADRLDNTNKLLSDLLIARTGQTAEVVAEWMSKDTWLTASQAKAVGLCGKVNPLAPALTPVEADSVITARRTRTTAALARAARLTPKAQLPAAPPAPASIPANPMATSAKPTPRAAKSVAKTAQPKARKSFWQSLKEFAAQADEDEAEANAAEGTEPTAELVSTELSNGAFIYHDGVLAVDSLVFNDEALTEPTGDGDYDTADSQVVTVLAGVVTAIEASEEAAATETGADATAQLVKRLDRLEANLGTLTTERDNLKKENEGLKKLKPAMPQARNARPNADAPDPKEAKGPKAVAPHHASL
jgi:ATP-dependent protease ClpP protease subunit